MYQQEQLSIQDLYEINLGIVQDEEEVIPRACRPLDWQDDEDQILGLHIINNEEEQEHFFTIKEKRLEVVEWKDDMPIMEQKTEYIQIPTWINNDSKYLTTSGADEFTDGRCQAQQNDDKHRNLEEILPPKDVFYSAAKEWSRDRWASQLSNKNKIAAFIWNNKTNEENLKAGQLHLLRKYKRLGYSFLWRKQYNILYNEFNKYIKLCK